MRQGQRVRMRSDPRHWDSVYRGGGAHSWDQQEPELTLELLDRAGIGPAASVVDVGGGDGALATALLRRGHRDVTILDISEQGLAEGRRRLGAAAADVRWLVTDVRTWTPRRTWDVWHDRALFHFLVDPEDRSHYGAALRRGTGPGSAALVGTFATDGPSTCSGLPVQRYDVDALIEEIVAASGVDWELALSAREEHRTPAGAIQPFTWVVLRRRDRADRVGARGGQGGS